MASSNSKPLLLQTQKPFSLLVISITFFFLLLNKVNSSKVLSFTFTDFVPNQKDIVLQGNAVVSSTGELQLTKLQNDKPIWNSVGRALYVVPIHIWDSNTGRVASFVSSFSFVVKAPDASKIADGIAFFLASPDSDVKTSGGLLGLFSSTFYNSSNQVVAVEFDTFLNSWDPSARHIGINVNSIQSKKTVTWNWKNGEVANVVINYQASTKTLTASLTYLASKTSYVISEVVDLKSVLPEWVRVGFSPSSGLTEDYVETHDVLSWSFTSTLQTS